MNRERAEHDGCNERKRAVERDGMDASFGRPPGQRASMKVQAGFRR